MKRQIAKVICKGIYTCVYDDERKVNPYLIYKAWDGHKKKIDEYADFYSAMDRLANIVFMVEICKWESVKGG